MRMKHNTQILTSQNLLIKSENFNSLHSRLVLCQEGEEHDILIQGTDLISFVALVKFVKLIINDVQNALECRSTVYKLLIVLEYQCQYGNFIQNLEIKLFR